MAPSRPARRGSRSAPAGPAWDEVALAPIVLIRAGEEVIADRAVARLVALARQKDPATRVTALEAASYEPHRLDTLVSPSLFGEPRLILVPALEPVS